MFASAFRIGSPSLIPVEKPGTAESRTLLEIQGVEGRIRLTYLDGLRGLAALYVMLHHMSLEVWPDQQFNGGGYAVERLITRPLAFGHYAVDLFIVLSGFCLMLPVVGSGGKIKGGTWGFLRRRARRILPPYYAALLLSLILIWTLISKPTGTPWDQCVAVTPGGLLAHVCMLQDLCGTRFNVWAQIDHPLWSVAVESHIYLLFPLLIWLWNRVGGVRALMASLLAIAAGNVLLHLSPVKILCFNFTILFCMGVAACAAAHSDVAPWPAIRRRMPWRLITLLSLAGFIALKIIYSEKDHASILFDPVLGAMCAALLVALSNSPRSRLRGCIQWNPIVFVGTFSYSLYLIHAPLIQVIWQYVLVPLQLDPVATFLAMVTIGSIIIVGMAYCFYLVWERPYMDRSVDSACQRLPMPAVH
jgi:peptidoglycan/LPS O-acetylase OafA/YrhL